MLGRPMRLPSRRTLAVALVLAVAAPACASDDEPAAVEIPEGVQRAFDGSCVADGCHDATTRAAGMSLDAADSMHIVNGSSSQSTLPLVHVGDLGGSYMAIKLLPDDQLPAGAERFEDRMPRDGVEGDDVEHVNTILTWIAGFGPSGAESGDPTTGGSTTGDASDSGDASSSGTTGPDPTDPGPTTITGGGPTNPACSVEEVTDGAVADPLDKGDEAGKFPLGVGVILEERCGCHTLADNALNTKFPALAVPVDTLLLDYGDLARPYEGSTLGAKMQTAVLDVMSMPPGSCPSIPDDELTVLEKWFLDGRPDGAEFVPP
jgi:hypothetical protein